MIASGSTATTGCPKFSYLLVLLQLLKINLELRCDEALRLIILVNVASVNKVKPIIQKTDAKFLSSHRPKRLMVANISTKEIFMYKIL